MKKQRWLSMILSLIMLCSMTVTTSAAAAKVTKKVITSVVFDAINNKTTRTFTYRSDGKISTQKYQSYYKLTKQTETAYLKYGYNSKGQLISISKSKSPNGPFKKMISYTYNSNGTIKTMNAKTFKYNSKNQLIKVYNKSYGDKYTYNAQGLVKSYFYTYGGTEELTYDSKKNKKTSVIYYRYTTRYNYTNTYKNGLLTKQVTKMNGAYQGTTTFKYKTVSVPSTSKAKVDKQQWAIRNDDYLSTIGGKYMSYN